MDRRDFMWGLAATGGWLALSPAVAIAAAHRPDYRKLVVLVEMKGGNDGLNTLVPYADPSYTALRPRIAIARDSVLQLSDAVGLHPSLAALMPFWESRELAVLQGVGYPAPNLSHFRSIEIWNTASKSNETRSEGWLARAFRLVPPPRDFVADALVVGQGDMGPAGGGRARLLALTRIEQYLQESRDVVASGSSGPSALAHIQRVEDDIRQAADHLRAGATLATAFPKGAFGEAVKTACQVLSSGSGVAAVRLTLNGFDTHQNQQGTHANLLRQLSEGLAALKAGLMELGRWNDTLVLTYAEFGRRPRENLSGGTDHGTASVHFALGGAVRGGLYGAAPSLDSLDGNGNLAHQLDFRSVYATVLNRWWGLDAAAVLGGKFDSVPFV